MITPIETIVSKSTRSFKCMPLQMGISTTVNKVRQFAAGKELKSSSLIEWIERIIKNSIEPNMLEKDMFTIMTQLISKRPTIHTYFDSTFSPGTLSSGRFIEGSTLEQYIPTYGLLQKVMDLDMPWEEWQKLNTVKLLYCDTGELPLKWYDQIKFEEDFPTMAIFGISAVELIMQYIVYAKEHDVDVVTDSCSDFCYKCIIPNLRNDLIENWMLVSMTEALHGNQVNFPETEYISSSAIMKYQYEIELFITNYSKRGTVIDKFLNHQWIRKHSILSIIKERSYYYQFDVKSRYLGIAHLSEKHLDDICMWLITHGSGLKKAGAIRSKARKAFVHLEGIHAERNIRNTYMKLIYRTHISDLGKLILE